MSATKSIDICVHCGNSSGDHCTFTPVTIPATCICDTDDWGDVVNIPKVCATFAEIPDETLCATCNHERACHADAKGEEAKS